MGFFSELTRSLQQSPARAKAALSRTISTIRFDTARRWLSTRSRLSLTPCIKFHPLFILPSQTTLSVASFPECPNSFSESPSVLTAPLTMPRKWVMATNRSTRVDDNSTILAFGQKSHWWKPLTGWLNDFCASHYMHEGTRFRGLNTAGILTGGACGDLGDRQSVHPQSPEFPSSGKLGKLWGDNGQCPSPCRSSFLINSRRLNGEASPARLSTSVSGTRSASGNGRCARRARTQMPA